MSKVADESKFDRFSAEQVVSRALWILTFPHELFPHSKKSVLARIQSAVDDNGLRSDKRIANEQENGISHFFWTPKTPDRNACGKLPMDLLIAW